MLIFVTITSQMFPPIVSNPLYCMSQELNKLISLFIQDHICFDLDSSEEIEYVHFLNKCILRYVCIYFKFVNFIHRVCVSICHLCFGSQRGQKRA